MVGVQQRVAERLARGEPADDAVAADRALPGAARPGGELDVDAQRVARAAGLSDRSDRLHALVGEQRGKIAEVAAVAVSALGSDRGAAPPGPELQRKSSLRALQRARYVPAAISTLIAPQPPEASASVPEPRSSENSATCSQPSSWSAGFGPRPRPAAA